MVHLPASSTVLQRRRGYRQVFQCFSRLRLAARVPLDRDLVRRLLESRDISELYEIWCYFTMVSAVKEILGPPIHAETFRRKSTRILLRQGFRVLWPGGTSLSYNQPFSPSGRGSYSVPLCPDITLSIPSGENAGLHLFDAKFRLDGDDFHKTDLHKMHAYRDALLEARSAWVLYPGTKARFFSTDFAVWDGSSVLSQTLEGVGALPLLPDSTALAFLRPVLASILGVAS